MIWACHFSIADVNQMLHKAFKFSAIQLTFGRQHVIMPFDRWLHLNSTGQRTKAALQAAKMRGVKLGSPQPKKGAVIRSQVLREKADRFSVTILPLIHGLQAQGITGNRSIARALNARGIQTANRRQWYPTTVKNLLKRTDR